MGKQWQEYKIFLKGADSPIVGQMTMDAVQELRSRLRLSPRDMNWIPEMVFTFDDADGDIVIVKVEQIAMFTYQPADDKPEQQVGFL
jgi:hypothetical protein